MGKAIKAIETTYKGYRFRSRLEARTAVLLEEAGIPYIYEPEGFLFEDGTTYLPDFYLPDQDAFLECKGLMSEKDNHKLEQLSKASRKDIVIMHSDMSFGLAEWVANAKDVFPWEKPEPGMVEFDSWLCKCTKCGKIYFGNSCLGWDCKCCGYYDGDGGFDVLCHGDLQERKWEKYEPIEKAKRARFEFGERGGK